MKSSILPDINVWLALAYAAHVHHQDAASWLSQLDEEQELAFNRVTQMGLLRLLTNSSVMNNQVKTQWQAWVIYDRFLVEGNARFMQEPRTLDESFRSLTTVDSPSAKNWTDSYLAAFAQSSGLILVTFDKALSARTKGSILLSV